MSINKIIENLILSFQKLIANQSDKQKMKIILAVYFVIQILILSSLMVLQIDLVIHAITMSLSCTAYLLVAFKNPGYYEKQGKQTQLSDEIHQNRDFQSKIIKQTDEQDDTSLNDYPEIFPQQKIHNGQISGKRNQQIPNNCKLNQDNILEKDKISGIFNKSQAISKEIQMKQTNARNLQKNHQLLKYCKVCKVVQPLRVRHCHECEKCICTFDHHCPWMSNCIGEKNKSIFWVYLLIQFIEFLFVLIDVLKKASFQENKQKIYIFGASVTLITLVSLVLLIFHTYLMFKNFTTWQFMRWDRISYLAIYKYRKSSPFSYGLMSNVTDYFMASFEKGPKQWTTNPKFLEKNKKFVQTSRLVKKKSHQKPKLKINQQKSQNQKLQKNKPLKQKPHTERAIASHYSKETAQN